MAVKKSKRTEAKRRGHVVKAARIPVKVKKNVAQIGKCKGCGWPIADNEHYCGECMCEDDCGY